MWFDRQKLTEIYAFKCFISFRSLLNKTTLVDIKKGLINRDQMKTRVSKRDLIMILRWSV